MAIYIYIHYPHQSLEQSQTTQNPSNSHPLLQFIYHFPQQNKWQFPSSSSYIYIFVFIALSISNIDKAFAARRLLAPANPFSPYYPSTLPPSQSAPANPVISYYPFLSPASPPTL